jgi:hypothetical protein
MRDWENKNKKERDKCRVERMAIERERIDM